MKKHYLLLFMLAFGLANAAVPANDDCVNAIELTPGPTCSTITGTAAEATSSSSTASCASEVNSDVWYKFTATTADVQILVQGSTDFDAVVELHGNCSGTSILGCVDNTANGVTEELNYQSLTIGLVYFIRVSDYSLVLPASPTFTICVVSIPVAPNDLCSNSVLLSTSVGACGASTNGYLSISNTGIDNGCIGNANDDVWYSFVATGANMNVQISSTFDVVIEAFSGTCGSLTNIACSDFNSIALTGLTTSETYYLRIFEYGSGIPTDKNFTICVFEIITPPNDECINAQAITPTVGFCGTTYNGTLLGATGLGGCTGDANDDVWYKVVANSSSMIFNVNGNFSTVIELTSSCGGSAIACSNSSILQVNGLTNGQEYKIRVYDYFSAPVISPEFTICAYSIAQPANDVCSAATSLVVNGAPISSTLLGATGDPYAACQGNADDDVWFSFTATQTTHAVKIENNSFSPIISLYLTCGGSVMACSDFSTLTASSLVIGDTYRVRVHSLGDFTVSFPAFDISVFTPISNDDCSNAIPLTLNATAITATSSNSTESTTACLGYANDDVWFTYTPTVASGDSIEVQSSSGYDAVLELRDGCIGTSVYCTDGAPTEGLERIITTALNVGMPYYIRVYHYSPTPPSTPDFTIQIKNATITNSIYDGADANGYKVFPNPTSGELYIQQITSGTLVELFTMQGTTMYRTTADASGLSIDMKSVAQGKGMYHLRLTDGEKVVVKKIIVQ